MNKKNDSKELLVNLQFNFLILVWHFISKPFSNYNFCDSFLSFLVIIELRKGFWKTGLETYPIFSCTTCATRYSLHLFSSCYFFCPRPKENCPMQIWNENEPNCKKKTCKEKWWPSNVEHNLQCRFCNWNVHWKCQPFILLSPCLVPLTNMRFFFSTIAYRSLLKMNCCLYFTANQKNGEASTIMGDHFLLGKLIIKIKSL